MGERRGCGRSAAEEGRFLLTERRIPSSGRPRARQRRRRPTGPRRQQAASDLQRRGPPRGPSTHRTSSWGGTEGASSTNGVCLLALSESVSLRKCSAAPVLPWCCPHQLAPTLQSTGLAARQKKNTHSAKKKVPVGPVFRAGNDSLRITAAAAQWLRSAAAPVAADAGFWERGVTTTTERDARGCAAARRVTFFAAATAARERGERAACLSTCPASVAGAASSLPLALAAPLAARAAWSWMAGLVPPPH